MFGTGLIMYLLNKEIYVVGPETVHAFVALSVLVYGIKKFGPTVASSCDKNIQVISTYQSSSFLIQCI